MDSTRIEKGAGRQAGGCFGFLPRRLNWRRKKTAAVPEHRTSWPTVTITTSSDESDQACESVSVMEAELDGEYSAGNGYCELLEEGSLETFAPWHVEKKTRIILTPYFGVFAGQRMTFHTSKRRESLVNIKVKVEGCEQTLTTLYHRRSSKRSEGADSIRDRCVRYAHEVKAVGSSIVSRNPPKLSFLCEQTILVNLDNLPVSQLPPKYAQLFEFRTQTVTVRVWPRNVCATPLRLRVKPHISIRELQWMLCLRLGLPSPACLEIYQADGLENLLPTDPIGCDQNELECVLLPSVFQKEVPIVVSVIGRGINHLRVSPTMPLRNFEQAVRKTFGMKEDTFLYLPQVFKSRRSSQCGLKMAALLDDTTISLIDSANRTLPVVDGIPSLQIGRSYEKLPLYEMSIGDLGLLKSSPVIAFEVTGPTIPVAFKTIQGDWSNTLGGGNSNSNFALISYSIRPHALSVNPKWTIGTLLKYIECISGVPCAHVRTGKVVLKPTSTVDSQLSSRCWLIKTRKDHLALPNDVPHVSPL